PIQITTPLSPGTIITADQPFTVRWTGGSPDALVRMQVISENFPNTGDGCECNALVSDQQVTMGLLSYGGGIFLLPVGPRDTARVIITVMPKPGQAPTVSAPGLTRDATHEWSYEYRFTGLQIRAR